MLDSVIRLKSMLLVTLHGSSTIDDIQSLKSICVGNVVKIRDLSTSYISTCFSPSIANYRSYFEVYFIVNKRK